MIYVNFVNYEKHSKIESMLQNFTKTLFDANLNN